MITDEPHTLTAVESKIDALLTERTARAAAIGPAYQRLWECIRIASDGGKRIRPRLLLLAHGTLGGAADEDALRAAAAFELLHTALLLHDDVLDGDLVRRGRPNLQGAFVSDALGASLPTEAATGWGQAAGVLAGDLLISAVHAMIAGIADPHRAAIHTILDECLFATAAGELADVGLAVGMVPATAPGITRMMHDKTSAYSFSAPLRVGALLADADRRSTEDLAQIGTMLGFIYQLRDDLLGVFGSAEAIGKTVDGDLREGKRTLLIAAAEHTDAWGEVRHLFGRRSLDTADADRLRDAIIAGGARQGAEQQLTLECARTWRRIEDSILPERLKAELLSLARHCAERES